MKSVHGVICGLIRQGLSASCPTASKGSPTVMALLPWQWNYMIIIIVHLNLPVIVFINTSLIQIL